MNKNSVHLEIGKLGATIKNDNNESNSNRH